MTKREYILANMENIESYQHYDIYHFLNSIENNTINFSKNGNGYFVDLNELSENCINQLYDKIENIIQISNSYEDIKISENNMSESETLAFNSQPDITKVDEKQIQFDAKQVETFVSNIQKNQKNNVYMKYSIAKKKYNKQTVSEISKKIDTDSDLKELYKEEYII